MAISWPPDRVLFFEGTLPAGFASGPMLEDTYEHPAGMDTRPDVANMVPSQTDLREDVAQALLDRIEIIINDSIVLLPFSAPQPLDADYCGRIGQVLVQLLAAAVRDGRLDPLQQAFLECGGAQCGICTPGMLIAARALLDENAHPSRDAIKEAIAGNLCRCTGYVKIIDAIEQAAR